MRILSFFISPASYRYHGFILALTLFVLSVSVGAIQASPAGGGFDVDAFDLIIIHAIEQKHLATNEVETTIRYTVASQLAVRIDTYQEGEYDFGWRLPSDAQNVQVSVDDADLDCAPDGNCRAYYDCTVIIIVPQCISINSTAHLSYQRTETIKQSGVSSAQLRGDPSDVLRPFPLRYTGSKYGGSGLYEVRLSWHAIQQPGQAPLRYRPLQSLGYTFSATDAAGVNVVAGVTDWIDFSLELWRQNPLLLIPGIVGSKLTVGGTELWPGLFSSKQQLTLEPSHQPFPLVTAPDIIGAIAWKKIYAPLLDFLQKTGRFVLYEVNNLPERRTTQGCDLDAQQPQYPTLFVFAYDWRKSNAENATLLADYVGCIQKFYPEVAIDILAHSMGGLLARRYLLDNPTAPAKRVITVGSPWLGTPKAILTLETGEFLGAGANFALNLSNQEVKTLTRYFPGFHELLTSQAYFAAGALAPFAEAGWDIDEDGNSFESYTYAELKNLLDQRFPTVSTVRAPMTQNEQFHSPAQDFQAENSSVTYVHLYGVTGANKTIAQLQAKELLLCNEFALCDLSQFFDPVYGAGDNTVTVASASRGNEADAKPNQMIYQRVTGSDMDHTDMLQTSEVLAYVRSLLEDRLPVTARQTAAATAPAAPTDAYYIYTINVISPTLVDAQGNGFAVDKGLLGNDWIDATHNRLGKRAHAFIVPVTATYTLTFQVGPQPAALLISEGDGVNRRRAVRYLDLAFPATRTLTLQLPFSAAALQQDSNDDGLPDTVITPRANVADALANDATPPLVTLAALHQGGLRQITVTAQDEGAGVQAIYYSTDGQHYQPYTAPFTVDPTQVKRIFAFAEDRVANRSSLTRALLDNLPAPPISLHLYLPVVARAGAATPTPVPVTPTPTPTPTVTPPPNATPTPGVSSVIDPTFGKDGRVVTPLGHSYGVDLTTISAYQPDGKVLGANGHTLFRVTAEGELDHSFGDSGFVTVLPTMQGLAVQNDGKIIVSGVLRPEGLETVGDFMVGRYLPDGRLDSTFAAGGWIRIDGGLTRFVGAGQSVLQPDGKVLVLGKLPYQAGDTAATPVLVRLLTTGAFDPTFGDNGKRFFQDAALPYLTLYTMVLHADGKILLGGDTGTNNEDTAALMLRLLPNGASDPAFAGDGQLITTFGAGLQSISGMTLQPDGKIVMAVSAPYGLLQPDNLDVVRVDAAGVLDATFGNGGHATLDLQDERGEYASDVVLLADGQLLLFGATRSADAPVLARFTADGRLDSSFGSNGIALQNVPQLQDYTLRSLVLQPDGKVVLAGSSNLWQTGPNWLTLVRLQADGTLDGTFADDGEVLLAPGNSVATTAALQADGKLLVGGYTSYNKNGAPEAWTILRYTADGVLDPSFDGDGQLVTTFGVESSEAQVQALAVQPDGKIVALGQLSFPAGSWLESTFASGIIRYNPDGTLDPTFGNQGQLQERLPLALDKTYHPLALQPDGKLVVVGNQTIDGKDHVVLVRLLNDGTFDPTFAGDGQVTTAFDNSGEARAVALQPDGKLVVAGWARTPTFADAFVLLRYHPTGALDTTFAGDGKLFTPFPQTEGAYAVAVQPDGKLLVAGAAYGEESNNGLDFTLVRYQPDGAIDPTFAGDGKVFTTVGPTTTDEIRTILLQPDGNIVAAGYTSDGYNRDVVLVRYQTTGAIDQTFVCGGVVKTDFGATADMARALLRQADGKVIAVGYTYYTITLARYLSAAGCH
ncbi:MAG: hypothetical protein R3E79_32345 [Caldilineaceae bacterium]